MRNTKEDNEKISEITILREQLADYFDRHGSFRVIGIAALVSSIKRVWKYAAEVSNLYTQPQMNPKLLPALDDILGMVYKIFLKYQPPKGNSIGYHQMLVGLRTNLKILRNTINKNRLSIDTNESEGMYLQRFIKYCFILKEVSDENELDPSEACVSLLSAQCFCVVRDLVLID